jgi:hypothetical protein
VIGVPLPNAWGFSASLSGTRIHIEHIEADDPGLVVPYWHVQTLTISELSGTLARGLTPGFGVSLRVPVRAVRGRIRFEDLARQPYTPPDPDTHHRNETLLGLADPELGAITSRTLSGWTLGGSAGASVPLGRTEPNPFALGRLGLPHQHIQFGTGTVDPLLGASLGRAYGTLHVALEGSTRLPLYENRHGLRTGNRFAGSLRAVAPLASEWSANAALSASREQAEKWSGRIEEEGNLGRTDVMLGLGIARAVAGLGAFRASVQIPLLTRSTGEQVKYPVILALGWSP